TQLLTVNGTSAGSFDRIVVDGNLDIAGSVHFDLASDALAMQLDTFFTLDSFFIVNGAGAPSLGEFADVTFSASSPLTSYAVTLEADRTFSVSAIPEPGALGLLGVVTVCTSRRTRRRESGRH